jgi:4-alpha-glucanotransferase
MSDRAAIEQLARIVGIEAHYTDTFGHSYTDTFGHSYKVSDETLLALIATFGQPELTGGRRIRERTSRPCRILSIPAMGGRPAACSSCGSRPRGRISLGLYRDLAVCVDPDGAEASADQELIASGASIGAPPDAFNRAGQNWGLAPVNPMILQRQGYAPFIAALRANICHAGILRIDHVMSLNRRYWIPPGMEASAGAEELLAPQRVGQSLSESGDPVYSTELGDAILTYLARSRARLMLIQLEDVFAEREQANLPGTTDAHLNWRRRTSRSPEELISGADLPRIAALTEEARLRSAGG